MPVFGVGPLPFAASVPMDHVVTAGDVAKVALGLLVIALLVVGFFLLLAKEMES